MLYQLAMQATCFLLWLYLHVLLLYTFCVFIYIFVLLTEYPDGSLRWPIQGYVRLQAGLTVDLIFVNVEVYAYIQLDAAVAIPSIHTIKYVINILFISCFFFTDINGDGWVSFDQIYYLLAANNFNPFLSLQSKLTLSAGFGLKIKVNLLSRYFNFHC